MAEQPKQDGASSPPVASACRSPDDSGLQRLIGPVEKDACRLVISARVSSRFFDVKVGRGVDYQSQ